MNTTEASMVADLVSQFTQTLREEREACAKNQEAYLKALSAQSDRIEAIGTAVAKLADRIEQMEMRYHRQQEPSKPS